MSASHVPRITPDEYLAIERAAETKSEYYDGQMYAMSGGTFAHSRIATNIIVSLSNARALRGKKCEVHGSDLRLRVAVDGLYTYPDVLVICGPPKFADNQADTLLNPTLIVEVLSKSTEAHDRGFKFTQYRKVESLREYMLVSQTEPRVELYRREPAGWMLSETVGLEGECSIPSLEAAVPMSEIYANVFALLS